MNRQNARNIETDYKNGIPIKDIARKYHTSSSTVCVVAKKAGLRRRHDAYVSSYLHLTGRRFDDPDPATD